MKNKIILLMMFSISMLKAEPDTMIVFDASGSMWGQIEGKNKIEIARDAMAEIAQGFDHNQPVGLMAYGHRRKGDCTDIETLVYAAAGTAKQITNQVNQLQPKGKTPLSQAVKLAAEQLKFTENQAEVVLITDGVETCDLDPCAVAAELESLGVDFKAHVIGFGLNADQGKQVSCMADITGGQYVAAENAAALNEALQQVILEKEQKVKVQLPNATVAEQTSEVVIGGGINIDWTGPAGEEDYIDVVKSGDERVYGELAYAWVKEGVPAQLRAPGEVGIYDVRYVWQGPVRKHVLATATLEVIDSEVTLVAPFKVAAGEYFSVQWQGPNRKDDYVDLVKKGQTKTFGELSYFYTKDGFPEGKIQAPAAAGEYDIRYVLEATDGRKVLHQIPIQVAEAEITLAFEPTAEVVENLTVFWTGPDNKDGYIDMIQSGSKKTFGEASYFYLKDNPDSGVLTTPVSPGKYDVRFIMVGAEGRTIMAKSPFVVTDVSATLELPDTAQAGSTITVNWLGPNRNKDYIDLIKAERKTLYGEITYFYTEKNPGLGTLVMPKEPGQYNVRYILQGKKRRILKEKMIIVQ